MLPELLPEANNKLLPFVDTGKGDVTLVFLHYFGGSHRSWSRVIDQLKKSFRCIAVDLRGFGNSPPPAKPLSVNDSAVDVLAIILALQLKKFVLIGHSMGGKIALSVTSKQPPGLIKLILICPSPPTPEPSTYRSRKNLTEAFGERSAIKKLIEKITAKPLAEGPLNETVATHLKTTFVAWNGWIQKGSRENISALMPGIKVPVLIISGASDSNFPTVFLKKEFLKYFPGASFKEIKGGHLLPVEVPLALAKLVHKSVTE